MRCSATPEKPARKLFRSAILIQIGGQTFTIIGMFEHYESEQEKKERELARNKPKEEEGGPRRQRGWGRRGGGLFNRKNMTVLDAIEHRLGEVFVPRARHQQSSRPRLSDIDMKVKDISMLEPALQTGAQRFADDAPRH